MDLNKIYCEDHLITMDKMPDNFVDLTVTSPPYDNLRDYKGYIFKFKNTAKQLFRVTKIGGVVVWVVNDSVINGSESLTSFKQVIYFVEDCGFNLHDTMIYDAKKPPLNHNRYEQSFEYMFIFSKGKPKTFNGIVENKKYPDFRNKKAMQRKKDGSMNIGYSKQTDVRLRYNIWKYSTGGGLSTKDKITFEHPAIFPEKLARDHIYTWSNENDLVYDPFMGSGTTAKMAHLHCIWRTILMIGGMKRMPSNSAMTGGAVWRKMLSGLLSMFASLLALYNCSVAIMNR